MKHLLASALLCVCAHHAALAQEQEMLRRNCRQCVITKTYDPFRKSTVVMLKPMIVADVTGGKMYVSLGTTCRADGSGFKKVVSLHVTFIAEPLVEAKDPVLRAQADESAINFGRLALSENETEDNLKVSGYTGLAVWEDVLKLGQGKKVEMSFDGIKVRLTDEQKAAILDFLAYGEGDPQ